MTKKIVFAVVLSVIGVFTLSAQAGKKVLFVDSYHQGYAWSDGIEDGIKTVLGSTGVELRVIHMDTKLNPSEDFKKNAALAANKEILAWKPDVVIAADDNASKYLIVPYFSNSKVPFVFCGVNWDASGYGFPTSNVTGMVEVALVKQVVDNLKGTAKGGRIGYLAANQETAKTEARFYNRELGSTMTEVYVNTLNEWKDALVSIQGKVDILIIGNPIGIPDWNDAAAKTFAEANTKIPSGSLDTFTAPLSLLTIAKSAKEQGVWSAKAALDIIGGKPVSSIPVVPNKEGLLIVNTTIVRNGGFKLPVAILKNAETIN